MTMTRLGFLIVLALLLSGGSLFLTTGSGEEPQSTPAKDLDPEVEEILRQLSARMTALPQLRFRAEITYDELEVVDTGDDEEGSDVKLQYSAQVEITMRREGALRVSYRGDLAHREFWYDGKKATLLDAENNVYGQKEISGNIQQALDALEAQTGFSPPLTDLLYPDPYALLRPLLRGGSYVGLHDVHGIACHHLLLHQDAADWQIWIDVRRLLPRKLVITYKDLPASPQFSAHWTEWDFDPRLPDTVFAFEAPEGAIQVEMVGSRIPERGK